MSNKLIIEVVEGPIKGHRIEVQSEKPMMIGRSKTCDLQFKIDSVSKQHCQIQTRNGKLYLQDMKSSNGTIVNGIRRLNHLETVQLTAGDMFSLADDVIFKVVQIPSSHRKEDNYIPERKKKRIKGGRYAGFWIRLGAFLIDLILLIFICYFIDIILNTLAEGVINEPIENISKPISQPLDIMKSIISTIIVWLYFAFMECSEKQATLGKMACGIIVTDLKGSPINFARATGRHFSGYLSLSVFFFGFIMAGFTLRKQALHDFISGSLVVYIKV